MISKWHLPYVKMSQEKAYAVLVEPSLQRKAELQLMIEDESCDDTKQLLRELLDGCCEKIDHYDEMVASGHYIPDWMCDSEGFHIDKIAFHSDGIERELGEIERLEKLKENERCTTEIAKTIDEAINKHNRFIGGHKKKRFEFKLKMNTMKQIHEKMDIERQKEDKR